MGTLSCLSPSLPAMKFSGVKLLHHLHHTVPGAFGCAILLHNANTAPQAVTCSTTHQAQKPALKNISFFGFGLCRLAICQRVGNSGHVWAGFG